jgi:orotate phosphoribosyltransferase
MTSLTSQQVLDLFRRVGALLEGHFKLSSGLHSPGFMQSALVLQYPREAETLGAALAGAVRSLSPDIVMSPALGGIVIGQEVARALNVPAIFAERQDGGLTLRRGFTVAPGARVLVIEDVVTTGGSTRETMDVATRAGGVVVGAGSIIDRSGGNQGLSVPYSSLAQVAFPTYQPDACPLCAAGSTAIKPGSRA